MPDKFAKVYSDYEGVATDGFAITPSGTVFPQPPRALYVGGSGNVCVQVFASTNTVLTFANVPAGTLLPIRVSIVYANTTASSIVGIF